MPILGSDRSGSRIQCSTYKENGSCKNGARYCIEKLEHAVVHALHSQLTNPTLIVDYIETYTEERRSRIRGSLDVASRTASIASCGLWTRLQGTGDRQSGRRPNVSLREARDKAQAELAMIDEALNALSFTLLRIKRFRENPDSLTETLSGKDVEIAPGLTQVFRELTPQWS